MLHRRNLCLSSNRGPLESEETALPITVHVPSFFLYVYWAWRKQRNILLPQFLSFFSSKEVNNSYWQRWRVRKNNRKKLNTFCDFLKKSSFVERKNTSMSRHKNNVPTGFTVAQWSRDSLWNSESFGSYTVHISYYSSCEYVTSQEDQSWVAVTTASKSSYFRLPMVLNS